MQSSNRMTDKSQKEQTEPTIFTLVVDDEKTIRKLMREFVEALGYKAFEAKSGEEALEILKRQPIDVVITDIMMPGLNGLDLTERIKENYDTEVIVMTGFSGDYSYEQVITKGASDFIFKPVRFDEFRLRLQRVLKERYLKEELKKLSITDDLTGLYNARHFYKQLEMEIERSNRYNHPLSLLLLDIDFFKNYNDTYGHLEGNTVLSTIGKVIEECLRTLDSAYRFGGEEFTIILPETDGEKAYNVAKRISSTIKSQRFSPKPGKSVGITVSIGISEYKPKGDMKNFIKCADMAMFSAKEQGRNLIVFLPCLESEEKENDN